MAAESPDACAMAVAEVFDQASVSGWVRSASDSGPVPVSLWANDVQADATYAIDAADRHAEGEVRTFRFALSDLWDFVGPHDRLTVRVGDNAIPISGHGAYVVPTTAGSRTVEQLRDRLAAGEVFSRTGSLQLSKQLDTAWQTAALELYRLVADVLRESCGYELFLTYGTLLGAIREGGFIGHDLDFDVAFLAAGHDGPAVARELRDVAFDLIDAGFTVRAEDARLQVMAPQLAGVRLNLFHVYTDERATVQFPFGAAGKSDLQGWSGTKSIQFAGAAVLVPGDPESVLEHVYGSGWRSPDPGFSWVRERRGSADDAALPKPMIEEIYWSDFYARTSYTSGSTFFELVNSRADLPHTVIDVGCGDGRDSFAFAAAGRTSTGIDRSRVGVQHAARKAQQLGLDNLFFSACDVGDADRLREALTSARGEDDEQPVAFYARFFLHSIPEDVQRTLMSTIAEVARPGDYFAAEFRTDKDEAIDKVHGSHYRRFQNGPAFGRSLRETYGFVPVLEQEGNGFSPYKGEDPQLYRVIARRPG